LVARQPQELLLGRARALGRMGLVQPAGRGGASHLDLARQLVADGPAALDLAPHAGADLQLLREGLLQALGRLAGAHAFFGEALEQAEGVLAAVDGGVVRHVRGKWKGACSAGNEKDCRTRLTPA
jgi:hypothetical protein